MSITIEARQLTKSYTDAETTIAALSGVDLHVDAGEFIAITGPSGSGKSTLLHLVGGLDRPTTGDVLLDGQPLSALSRDELADVRNRRIGFVFQFFNLLPSLTVEENVALPALIAGTRTSTYRARVDELLARVGLADKPHRYPAQLSGGEQQRVAVARALVMSPAVLLADEPTGNLDTRSGSGILSLLAACHADGQTIVLVTHDVRVASQTQRVVFLRDGRLADEARLDTVGDRDSALSRMVQLGEDEHAS
jgi:putative ABC transport system ATP-binding protein